MTGEQAKPQETSAEQPDADLENGAVKRPRKEIRPLTLVIAVIVVAIIVCASAALAGSLLSGKMIDATGYDLLLDEDDMPSGWSTSSAGFPISRNNTEVSINGKDFKASTVYTSWTYEPSGGEHYFIHCTIHVLEGINDAHSAYVKMLPTGPGLTQPGVKCHR